MEENTAARHEHRFRLATAAVTVASLALVVWFAVPFAPQSTGSSSTPAPIVQSARVDLNRAGLEALCTLPGIGEAKAQAILDYRRQYGTFRRVEDAANVPGVTASVVASWEGLAYVS